MERRGDKPRAGQEGWEPGYRERPGAESPSEPPGGASPGSTQISDFRPQDRERVPLWYFVTAALALKHASVPTEHRATLPRFASSGPAGEGG